MKKIILCALLLSGLWARAEDPALKPAIAPSVPSALSGDDPATYKTEDDLWKHLNDLLAKLGVLRFDEVDLARSLHMQIIAGTRAYQQRYPEGPHAAEARMLWAQSGDMMLRRAMEGGPSAAEVAKTYEDLASDPKVPEKMRAQIRVTQLFKAIQKAMENGGDATADWNAVEGKFADFQKQFGSDFSLDGKRSLLAQLRRRELRALRSLEDQSGYNALLKKLLADPVPQLAEAGKLEQAMIERVAKLKTAPLELKYTAVDGTEVDVSKLRGKVVLIDFWATWCGPCVAAVPDVVAAYKQYHDQGFEVVGVSLDDDKNRLLAFTQKHGMVWPQAFDGGDPDSPISTGFGIESIPTMWLLDKKGMLVAPVDSDAIGDEVEKLLKAP